MSGTTATISILKLDKTIQRISVNYDGNPSYTGKVLSDSYANIESVEALISQGNLSALNTDKNLSNKDPALIFSTKKEYLENIKYYSFNYIFTEKDNTWYLVKGNKLKNLHEVLEDDKALVTKKRLK